MMILRLQQVKFHLIPMTNISYNPQQEIYIRYIEVKSVLALIFTNVLDITKFVKLKDS